MAVIGLPWAGKLSDFPINQPFGGNFSGEPPGHGQAHFHEGVDFGMPESTPLIATAPGTVKVAGQNTNQTGIWGYGANVLLIDHGNGYLSLYGHMSSLSVSAGQSVTAGQPVGLSGGARQGSAAANYTDAEGNSTGPHLHYTLYHGLYDYVDPMPLMGDQSAANAGTLTASGVPASGVVGYAQVIVWARQAGVPEPQLATAAAIAMAESSLRINAQSPPSSNFDGSTGNGLWQIESTHTQYDITRLRSDGAYNAKAMYDISHGGTDWSPWSTYNRDAALRYVGPGNGTMKQYLPAAQAALAATPPGTQVPLPSFAGGSAADATPVIVVPNLPVNQVDIAPVRVNASGLSTQDNAEAVAYLGFRAGFLAVDKLTVKATAYRAPGSFTASTDLGWIDQHGGTGIVDNIVEPSPTQVTAFMGYIPNTQDSYTIEQLAPVFGGLLDEPEFTHEGPADTLDMSGPDFSAILSEPNATPHDLSQYASHYSHEVVEMMVKAHNPKGTNGLTVQAAKTTTIAGQVFNNSGLVSGQTGQTEWDIINQLAANEGFVCWFSGSTLYWGPLPPENEPLVLEYGFDEFGRPLSPVTKVNIKPNKHSKRDYNIVVTSYNQKTGKTNTVTTGNPQSSNTMTFPQPTNTTPGQLKKIAAGLLAVYSATEVICTIEIAGFIQLKPGQPIAIQSDRIIPQYRHPYKRFYPVETTYDYDKDTGNSLTIVCTNRPWGLQSSDSAQSGVY